MEGIHREERSVLRNPPGRLGRRLRRRIRTVRGARVTLSPANLGERISILFKISGDAEHPFSEVTGVLMRIEQSEGPSRNLHVIRRNGEVVVIPEIDVVKLKLIPPGTGRFQQPAAWTDNVAQDGGVTAAGPDNGFR